MHRTRLAPRQRSLPQAPLGAQAAAPERPAPSWLRCPRCCSFRAPAKVTHGASAARSARSQSRQRDTSQRRTARGSWAVSCYEAAITRPLPAAALLAGLRHASLDGRVVTLELPRRYGLSIVAERARCPSAIAPGRAHLTRQPTIASKTMAGGSWGLRVGERRAAPCRSGASDTIGRPNPCSGPTSYSACTSGPSPCSACTSVH